MDRRSFLQLSAAGAAALMLPVGCGDAPDPELDVAAGTLRARSDDGLEAEVDPLRANGKVGGRAFGGFGMARGETLLPAAGVFAPPGALVAAGHGGSRRPGAAP